MAAPARCTVVRLAFTDLDRAAEDPKLAGLLAAGWTVIAFVPLGDDARTDMNLILAPPPEQAPPAPVAPTQDQIRAILTDSFAPVAARFDVLEARVAAPAAPPAARWATPDLGLALALGAVLGAVAAVLAAALVGA